MELTQKRNTYHPVKLVFETRKEANTFMNIIDDLDPEDFGDPHEKQMIIKISDAFGNTTLDI